jgi:integrase/recombinase XerD
MTDRNGGAIAPSRRLCVGPLVIHIDGFAARLGSEGYTPRSTRDKCELVADLSRWLDRRGLSRDVVDEELLRQFHAVRRRRGHVRRGEAATGWQLLGYLRDLGCIQACPPEADRTSLGDLTQDFGRYLRAERGLSAATLNNYLPIVRRFLIERFGSEPMRLDELRPIDIHRFIVRRSQTGSRRWAQLMVTALRSFLRFLQQQRQSCCSTPYCGWSRPSGRTSHEHREYISHSA